MVKDGKEVELVSYAEPTGKGVERSLGTVRVTPEMVSYFKSKRSLWKTFGRMDTHLYRNQLFAKFDELTVSPMARMLVFTMCAIIKSQPRIVAAMKEIKAADKFTDEDTWFTTRNFIETYCTQYVKEAKKSGKFPVVNLPNTVPGLDILWFCLLSEDLDRTLDNLSYRPTFVQIHLRSDAQTKAKQGNEYFWTKIVKGSRNPDASEKPEFRESYYNTQAGDKYLLYQLDEKGMLKEYRPVNDTDGYSLLEVESYLRSFNENVPKPSGSKSS